jgi:hypothetical protein
VLNPMLYRTISAEEERESICKIYREIDYRELRVINGGYIPNIK